MGRETKRLSARAVATLTAPGRHADGGNLYLSISPHGGRRWVFLFRWSGRQVEMGLGAVQDIPLARARELATAARQSLAEGANPLEARKAQLAVPTLKEAADALIDDIAPGFRSEKHLYQWRLTFSTHAAAIKDKLVSSVTTEDVLSILKPMWSKHPETAARVRARIERVLDAARAQGHRQGENPARWRGHLDSLLPKRQRLQRGHHKAVPYPDVPAFYGRLGDFDGSSPLALAFVIATAARTGEARGATWAEVDFSKKVWTVPATRMKAAKEHRVPLSEAAIDVLSRAKAQQMEAKPSGFIFPGGKADAPLSIMALEMLMRRMKVDATVHGFRSSFRDWAGEETSFPREVAEAALAHTVGNAVEQAYRRGDALEKRRKLMEAWGDFITGAPSGRAGANAA